MRLRNVPGARDAIEQNPMAIKDPESHRGQWKSLFKKRSPIRLEIGMGKGDFIITMAGQNPNINYIGIEKFSSVLVRALQKAENLNLTNLFFIRMDAENICDVFSEGEIDRIYLNFSDPWPKDRHSKRRLTSAVYFARYDSILKKDGTVEFKTDNNALFDFSLEEIPKAGWKVMEYTRDLHHDAAMCEGNIMTEYEKKFSALGHPINKLIAARSAGKSSDLPK